MDITFFHHTLRLGSGIDTVIFELANRLARNNNVTVLCFKTTYKEEECNFRLQEIRSPFADTPTKMMVMAPFIFDRFGELRSYIKRADVINTHHYPANYIVRNFSGPLNVVTEWSGVTTTMFSSFREKLYVKWAGYANRVAAKRADVVLAPCEFVRKWIYDNYGLDAVTMFLDGINFQRFDRRHVNADRFYSMYPPLEKKKIVLFVGRITESKNIHTLIETFALVKRRMTDVALVLVGDYQSYIHYYNRLKSIIRSRRLDDSVIFSGIVSWTDLPSFFAASTIYATCSLWEGFLRAEAYAFGKPIVCFNTGANSETVKDGYTGFVVENNDANAFAERMYQLLVDDNLAKQMGENGYAWARENLDFDSIVRRFQQFCEQRLTQRGMPYPNANT
ncbi:MAG: glycosyltransferase family 4 protein [Candidatus Nitrosocaldus sp.]|nr:glycosyltransferase family 4 protein [Candidatus Nitrosocaldus sp.]MDW8275061.1 glycosyltransferase family 4 protein [Candidatus Nitrosocaldus sp.]